MFVEQVKEIRKDLKYLMKLCKRLHSSREMSIAITSMEKSRMWFGKYLSMLDEESPYAEKDGKRKTVSDIFPESDVTERKIDEEALKNPIQKIDELREWLKYQSSFFSDHWFDFMKNGDDNQELGVKTDELVIVYAIITNLSEARMYLGLVLNQIKNNENL